MKNKFPFKIYTVALATSFSLSFVSCKEMIEVEPRQSINASTALTTRENIEAAITSAYVNLKSTTMYGNRLITLPEALSDNGQATAKSGRLVNEARNQRGAHFTNWFEAYSAINKINLTLAAVPILNVAGVDQARKDVWVGELKFLRALYYFDLVRTYAYIPGAVVESKNKGGVPLVLEPITTADAALAYGATRSALDVNYDAIYADLDDAISKLGNLGVAGTASPIRASKTAAQALYSRVALYRKDFPKVIEMATAAIATKGTLLTPTNYVAGWSSTINPESIFEVAFQTSQENIGVNESLQTTFTTLVTRGNRGQTGGFGDLVPTNSLLTALGLTVTGNGTSSAAITSRSSDVRNLLFELGTTGRGNPFVEVTKFIGKNAAVNLDNVPVIRVAEMYLNRAEASAALGQETGALADVNRVRTNRGLAVSDAVGNPLMDEIMLQRRLEFAFEGHRFFDLKRKGLDINKPTLNSTINFTEDVILPGIPQSEIDTSKKDGTPTLAQNSGY